MTKPKIAVSWNSSCGGCDESIVDIEEKIIDVASQVEFVLWPCAMDFKYEDVEKMEDGEITVSLINGGIQNTHQQHVVEMLRKKSKIVIAFGSCAYLGGIPSLVNLKNRNDVFSSSYLESPTVVNPEKIIPQTETNQDGFTITLPEQFETVYKLDDIIDVDYYLPGCPPTASMIAGALEALLSGNMPAKGAVLASNKTLCTSCDRNESKPNNLNIETLKRIHEVQVEEGVCFLSSSVLCMGPATRDGCDYPCIKGNMPCTGCMGGVENADQGAKMIGTLGGILGDQNEKSADVVNQIADPAGTFYRYCVANSLLGRKRPEDD